MDIGKAIELKNLVKIYELRKLQFRKLSNNHTRYKYMLAHHLSNLNYDLSIIKYKIKLFNVDFPHLSEDEFDKKVGKLIKNIDFEEKALIFGDFSYNVAHIAEFEAYAYNEYIDE